MKEALIYVHGKGGSAAEADHYRPLFSRGDVIGFDYQSQTPWEAKEEFSRFFDVQREKYDSITLLANSIGAFFSMNALSEKHICRALMISPVVHMEKLIQNMMLWAGVTEAELQQKKEIPTTFGETLSWDYLCYVRNNPICWTVPTSILYGGKDNLTSLDTISAFAQEHQADLTILPGGEHWFHTQEQMAFVDLWLKEQRL